MSAYRPVRYRSCVTGVDRNHRPSYCAAGAAKALCFSSDNLIFPLNHHTIHILNGIHLTLIVRHYFGIP